MYVVTAIDSRKHYSRQDISIPFLSKARAEAFIRRYRKEYKDALPKYKTLSKFKIERRKK